MHHCFSLSERNRYAVSKIEVREDGDVWVVADENAVLLGPVLNCPFCGLRFKLPADRGWDDGSAGRAATPKSFWTPDGCREYDDSYKRGAVWKEEKKKPDWEAIGFVLLVVFAVVFSAGIIFLTKLPH